MKIDGSIGLSISVPSRFIPQTKVMDFGTNRSKQLVSLANTGSRCRNATTEASLKFTAQAPACKARTSSMRMRLT